MTAQTCARCGAQLRNTADAAWAGAPFICRACANVDTRPTRADLDKIPKRRGPQPPAWGKPPLDKRQDSG